MFGSSNVVKLSPYFHLNLLDVALSTTLSISLLLKVSSAFLPFSDFTYANNFSASALVLTILSQRILRSQGGRALS